VTGLQYVAVPLGVNSYRPHAAASVLANQFGDCKDKANLFNALLHVLSIDARLVLVPRFRQASQDIPGFAFNHAISRVTLDGRPMWVDTTDGVCRFGMLPPGDPGRNVLVIDGQTTTLTQLPAPDPKDHSLELRGQIDCAGSGPDLPATLAAVAHGFPDYEMRAASRENSGIASSIPLLASRYRPVAGAFALEKQHATSAAALDEDFSWHADGAYVGLSATGQGRRSLQPPFWLPVEWDLALHHRKSALFLNQGYPLTLDENFEMSLGESGKGVSLPEPAQNTDAPLRWKVEWARMGDAKLAARFHAESVRGKLSSADTPVFQRQLRDLLAALGAGASVSPAK